MKTLRSALLGILLAGLASACSGGNNPDGVDARGSDVQADIQSDIGTDVPTDTQGSDGGDAATDASTDATNDTPDAVSCVGDGGCFACPPTTSIEFLNQCTGRSCTPFDNRRLGRLPPDGRLPPLP